LARPPVIAVSHRSKLIYNESQVINPTGAAATAYVFSANGLYDPNITGLGHQPMGFDQLMLLYEHYTVLSAKITVSFQNETAAEQAHVGIALFPDASIETNHSKLIENGLLKRTWVSPPLSGMSQKWLTHKVDIAKLNGVPKSIVGDASYRGDVASNPTEQSYFHIFGFNLSTVNAVRVFLDVTIEYDAVFTEPRKLAQS